MKIRPTSYTFDASAQTIVCAGFTSLEAIQLITNVTDNIIIYNFADATKGGTLSGTTLTLTYDTTSMADTDKLQILVEDGSTTEAVSGTVTANLSATDNAVLDAIAADTAAIKTAVEILDNTVSGSETQVDVVSSALPTGAATSAKQDTIIGHVDGIETLLTTIDADTSNISTKIDTLAGAVAGTEIQVDVLTMPTTTVQATNLDIRDLSSASDTITVHGDVGVIDQLDLTNSNPAAVAIVDGNGDQITSFGGGTQYTEGDTDASITGTAALVEGAANALAVLTQPLTDTQLRAADVKITLDGESVPVTNAGITTIAGAVSGTEMQVDVLTSALPTGASTLAEQQSQTTHLATIAGDTTNIETAVQLIDDTVYTDGSGTVTKGIAILGQDGTNPQAIKTDTNGELQVDVLTMPTTTVQATNLDIRDLTNADVVTAELSAVDNAVLDAIAAKDFATQTTLAAINAKMVTGTDIGDVTINNASGASAVNIQDGGNTITVDGTVAVTNSDITSTKTAVELIDDAIYVDDADWTADTSKHALVGGVTQATPSANTDGDTTPLITNSLRELRIAALESDLATAGTTHVKKYYTNSGAVTDGIIWSPAAGKRWFLTTLAINVSAASTVTVEDDLSGGDSPVYKAEFAANSGVVLTFPVPMFSGEDAADLLITTSAGNVYVTAVGYEI